MYSAVIALILLLSVVFIVLEKKNYALVIDKNMGLSAKTLHVLNQVKKEKPVKFTVFSRKDSVVANKVKQFLLPFKKANQSLVVEFVDPSQNPNQIKTNSITMQGEIVLSYQDDSQLKKINITELSESAISNALLRLQNQSDEWIVFAERFGMKTIGDESDTGLSQLLIHLKKSGFNIARMPLDKSVVLPDNVKLLVLANPVEALNSQLVDYLVNLMESGVSILWLDDINSNQANLELALGSFSGNKLSISDEMDSNYLSDFPNHAITENFNQPIFIAEAKEIILEDADTFIASTNDKTIAVAAQLLKSRLIIVGDSDFISNQYLSQAANKSMIERMVDWLLYHNDRINIPVQINKNTQLVLSQTQLIALSVIFLLFIPLLFLSMAIIVWRKNRVQP
jgi:hypothetical protein